MLPLVNVHLLYSGFVSCAYFYVVIWSFFSWSPSLPWLPVKVDTIQSWFIKVADSAFVRLTPNYLKSRFTRWKKKKLRPTFFLFIRRDKTARNDSQVGSEIGINDSNVLSIVCDASLLLINIYFGLHSKSDAFSCVAISLFFFFFLPKLQIFD